MPRGPATSLGVTHDVVGGPLPLHPLARRSRLAGLIGGVGLDQGLETVEVVVGGLASVQPEEGAELAERVAVAAGPAQQLPFPAPLVPVDPGAEHESVAGVLAGDRAGQPGVVAMQVVQDVPGGVIALVSGL